ncbi:hypothetical protein RHOER0001_4440 [Rhodococcus erythropolis SK121]|nr:hypothetical protein RHOER0001_4440 [Rhodococcus erythropolis SK121]
MFRATFGIVGVTPVVRMSARAAAMINLCRHLRALNHLCPTKQLHF